MAGKSTARREVDAGEIVRLFWEGLSIQMLAHQVSAREGTTAKAARAKVERILYEDDMRRAREIRAERAKEHR